MNEQSCEICGSEKSIETHHTSYYPERTMPVCSSCHNKIHHTDGFHDELEPERTRPKYYTEEGSVDDTKETCRLDGSVCETVTKDNYRRCIFCLRWFDDNDELLNIDGHVAEGEHIPKHIRNRS